MEYIGNEKLNYDHCAVTDSLEDLCIEKKEVNYVKVYINYGYDYNDENSYIVKALQECNKFTVKINNRMDGIRINPGEKPCTIKINTILFKESKNKPNITTNGFNYDDNWFYFYEPYPTINIELNNKFNDDELYVDFYASQDINEMFFSVTDKYRKIFVLLTKENDTLNQQLSLFQESLYGITNSLSWKITGPLRVLSHKIRQLLNNFTPAEVSIKRLLGLKKDVDVVQTEDSKDSKVNGYKSFYQDNLDFSSYPNDREIKALAFYLPQFHTFPENDEWWGTGFTEWTNTRKAEPRYKNHYQPRTPHGNIGYYDLSEYDVLIKQANLAKEHGIYGFCFYYYWFSGKRLMEKPLDLFLEHKEIDIKFCLCWANENWTRTWDGLENDVLIEQKYRDDDVLNYVRDIKKYISDDRYIRINGKPVLMIYNALALPDTVKFFKELRFYAKEEGIGDILVWICKEATFGAKEDILEIFVDKMVEFPPRGLVYESIDSIIDDGYLYDYKKLVNKHLIKDNVIEKDVYKTAMLGWDNSARRRDHYAVFENFDIKCFYDWVRYNSSYTAQNFEPDERYMFINAWNEWAEGTYLEPDEKHGYTSINTFSRALFELDFDDSIVFYNSSEKARILIQAHIFYEDLTEEIVNYLNNIPEYFDCYITTNTIEKANEISKIARLKLKANKVKINVSPNRGRDVAPFILQVKDDIFEYEYFCHIHTKKSHYFKVGDEWRQYLLINLLYSEECISRILDIFESNNKIGIIYPETYPKIESRIAWGGNKETTTKLFERIGCVAMFDEKPEFPAGNMFWARVDAVRQIFESDISFEDFPEEQGQIDSTLAHAIERSWYYIVKSNGYTVKKIREFRPNNI